MSKVFICAAIPDEQAIKEEGAVAVATAIEAGDERRARAKFHWQFLEHYPAAQDCAYKFLVCEDKPGIPRPALDSWDAEYMQENRWDEASASFVPVETESDPMNVTFDNLAPEVQNAVMVKFDTCENITVDMVIKWWLKQSREAQSAIMTDEIPLDDALLQLREFIDENSGEFFVHVWGNGANFDNTILRRSYERQGIPCPWRYYNDRDVRTIVELGKAIDFDARTAIPFEGERHNALDDARYQAKYVSAIWQKLIPSQADS
ncbi:3'-5' exonuclease [Escherichia coli]